jgi:hypothetical protein
VPSGRRTTWERCTPGKTTPFLGVGWLLVRPHVVVDEPGIALAGESEPRVLVRGVVEDQVDDDAHPAIAGGVDEIHEVPEVPGSGWTAK